MVVIKIRLEYKCFFCIKTKLSNSIKKQWLIIYISFVFVVYKKKTVGITPLYPKTTTLELVTNTSSPRTDSTFFGKERCNFYEKQVAVEAFEYVFSYPNCHPCDIFSQNSPFFCDRTSRKTWLNIFALAISNTLFLVGIMIAWAPILLRVFLGKH